MSDNFFLYSLIAGFVFSFFLFLSSGKFRIPYLSRFLRRRAGSRTLAVPVPFGLFLTAFGLSGLIARNVLHLSPLTSFVCSFVSGIAFFMASGAVLSRIFADTGEALVGTALRGTPGHVCLAIPEGGTGRIAYIAGGRRVTSAARCLRGGALAQGERILIVEFYKRIALVDRA